MTSDQILTMKQLKNTEADDLPDLYQGEDGVFNLLEDLMAPDHQFDVFEDFEDYIYNFEPKYTKELVKELRRIGDGQFDRGTRYYYMDVANNIVRWVKDHESELGYRI